MRKMTPEEKVAIVREVGEEIIAEDELLELFKTKEHPVAYDGFEPSGKIHIAQGLLRTINVNKLTSTGIKFKFWVADWFALMNNKLGGDLNNIQLVGKYFIEVWKACGMDLDNVEFLWASEMMNQEYWLRVVKIGTLNSVTRITRCAQIMGRSETDKLSAAQMFYPCMQAGDIFHLGVDIAQLGMDQRKVNVLAREIAPKLGEKKPIAVHHHMLMGLKEPKVEDGMSGADAAIAKKMSKSDPSSAIFMTDTKDEISKKFKKAYCPEGQAQDNPVLEYCKYIVFEKLSDIGGEFLVERPEKYGGNLAYKSYADLEDSFVKKELHPVDLKQTTAKYIDILLEPIRKHFETPELKKLKEQVEELAITR